MPSLPRAELSLFLHRARDLVARRAVSCAPETSVAAVAQLMTRERIGSVVVVDGQGRPIGIVTDRDLRRRIVAAGLDAAGTPAAAIMSSPVATTGPDAFAFEALLEMTRRDIHHLPVVAEGRVIGMLSSQDFLRWQTSHPVMLTREIARAASVEELAVASRRTTTLVAGLVEQGGSAHDVGRIVAELNDRIVARVLELSRASLEAAGAGPPPVPYCWLAFGSEARREQTLRTDQDNGLVYADSPDDETRAAAAAYFARLAETAIQGLVTVGFPPCPGKVMASNPQWCQPVSVWAGYFERWIDHPSPEEVLAVSIHFDLRPIAGATDLAAALTAVVRRDAPKSLVLLGLLAREAVTRRLPLTIFGNIATAGSGPHRGTVDVKAAGVMQLVGAARVAALELALEESNTVERFRAASQAGLYTPAEFGEISDAYGHLLRLRLVHQLARLAEGAEPDNHVDPARLSHADSLLFHAALRTVEQVQAGLRQRFLTDRLG